MQDLAGSVLYHSAWSSNPRSPVLFPVSFRRARNDVTFKIFQNRVTKITPGRLEKNSSAWVGDVFAKTFSLTSDELVFDYEDTTGFWYLHCRKHSVTRNLTSLRRKRWAIFLLKVQTRFLLLTKNRQASWWTTVALKWSFQTRKFITSFGVVVKCPFTLYVVLAKNAIKFQVQTSAFASHMTIIA